MSVKDQVAEDVKSAMRAKEKLKLDTLRMVSSVIKNKEIEKKSDLEDGEVVSLIGTMVKQRKEAADLYRKGDREDLAEKEEEEIAILKVYLPEQLSKEDLMNVIDDVVNETGASSMAEMGKVMKLVMAKVAGKAEGKMVNEAVKERLSS